LFSDRRFAETSAVYLQIALSNSSSRSTTSHASSGTFGDNSIARLAIARCIAATGQFGIAVNPGSAATSGNRVDRVKY